MSSKVDITRRAGRAEETSHGGADEHERHPRGPREAGAKRARASADRFFADSHGVRPAPILTVGLESGGGGDLGLWRHSVVICADRRGAVRS